MTYGFAFGVTVQADPKQRLQLSAELGIGVDFQGGSALFRSLRAVAPVKDLVIRRPFTKDFVTLVYDDRNARCDVI